MAQKNAACHPPTESNPEPKPEPRPVEKNKLGWTHTQIQRQGRKTSAPPKPAENERKLQPRHGPNPQHVQIRVESAPAQTDAGTKTEKEQNEDQDQERTHLTALPLSFLSLSLSLSGSPPTPALPTLAAPTAPAALDLRGHGAGPSRLWKSRQEATSVRTGTLDADRGEVEARDARHPRRRQGLPSRSRERVPFPRDTPALPTITAAAASSTSSLASTQPHTSSGPSSGGVSGAQAASGSGGPTHGHSSGSTQGHGNVKTTAAVSNGTAAVSRSLLPVFLLYPLPILRRLLRPHQTPTYAGAADAASQAKALLVTAATRAPGSPPQHIQSHAATHLPDQNVYAPQPSSSSARAGSQCPTQFTSTRQGTPFPGQRTQRTPERRPPESGTHLTREGTLELALDVKRLLAKPVSLSAPSVVSHARAESTSAADGPALRRKRYDTAGSCDGHLPPRQSEDGPRGLERERQKKGREAALVLMAPHSGGEDKEMKEKRPKNPHPRQ
ncbi:hypothetical protein C8R45DRAFT_1125248 [Mycena sanguinolenta]|nr:hypothetical protein C8R45DRAFT_1125248 [Mycena sanguinolenta]